MVEGKFHVAAVCNGTTATSADEEMLHKPSKARKDPLICVPVHASGFLCTCTRPVWAVWSTLVKSRSSFVADAKAEKRYLWKWI